MLNCLSIQLTLLLLLQSQHPSMAFTASSLPSSFLGLTLRPHIRFAPNKNCRCHWRSIATKSIITMMPEGPEVRTLVDQLQGTVGRRLLDIQFVSGRYVRNGKPDGFVAFAGTMSGLKDIIEQEQPPESVDIIQSWQAKGKFSYIILDNCGKHNSQVEKDDNQRSIWITLGMSGKFVNEKVHAQDSTHGRWYLEVMNLDTQKKTKIYYHDVRNFGTLKFCLSKAELNDKLESLGPDILEPATTTEDVFVDIISKKKNADLNICKFLMNQSNISGIGNYILAEGLYRAAVDPFASLRELSEQQQRALFRELQSIALESYSAQGMTRRQGGVYANVDGSKGQFEMQLQCYGKQFCPRGNLVIKKLDGPHGRTIWYTSEQLFMPLSERFQSTSSRRKRPADTSPPMGTTSTAAATSTSTSTSGWPIFESSNPIDRDKSKLLLSSLVEPGWLNVISDEAKNSDTFQRLAEFLYDEIENGQTVYPPHNDVFAALNVCRLENTKVVIVGQDPYHGPGQGHGLAFSVRKGISPPPSLKNIFKEAMDDVGIDPPTHGNLEHWAKQGVLLLNSVLTVRRGAANSHAGKGWEEFTDFAIRHLNEEKEGLVFLLFGNPAQKKASSVDKSRHTLIRTSHPSPLGASKTAQPFLGSRCFSQCNKILEEQGLDPIDWNVR